MQGIFSLIVVITVMVFMFIFFIPSGINGVFPPYNAPDTMLVDTNEFTYARAIGVVVDNITGSISFPTYYNWEVKNMHYEWVRHDGNFVYKVGEVRVRPNNLDGCWKIEGCK